MIRNHRWLLVGSQRVNFAIKPYDCPTLSVISYCFWGGLIRRLSQERLRMTGGNFRLLTRLLTQIERVLSVNDPHLVSTAVVEAAWDSLVIGPG